MLKLGVNIDHVATLRQARGTAYPSIPDAARLCEDAGCHSITVHLREDRRHIQDRDVYDLRRSIRTRLNLEMANAAEIVEIALEVLPEEVCIVPEKRQELTTEGGLDVVGQREALARNISRLAERGIAVSLFIEPDPAQIRMSAELGAPCIELHTGTFCDADAPGAAAELERLVAGAELAHTLGLIVNAGHGLHAGNVRDLYRVPHLDTLNIGHSIVCRAVMIGLPAAVREMLTAMADYPETPGVTPRFIIGTGIDIVENVRMAAVLERWGSRFLDRVFLPAEQVYCRQKANPVLHLAGRFAVKEAVSKALGTGLGPHLGWLDIETVRNPSTGAPSVQFTDRARQLADSRGVHEVHISLSHCREYAVAHAILVGRSA